MRDFSPAAGSGRHENHANHALLNMLIGHLHLEDDRALAQSLKVAPYIVEMMREGRLAISPSMLLWIHDATGVSLRDMRALLDDTHDG